MPQNGDSFTVKLKAAHLGWGDYRFTGTRPTIYGEGYIMIPANISRRLNIYNSNYQGDTLGVNLFRCTSTDGFFSGILKAQGCSAAGEVHAKQFSEYDNLKGIGGWYSQVNAQIGDTVLVRWISPTEVIISII